MKYNRAKKIKLAVLIITYNRLELLKECIAAVECQTINEFKVLIIDNASNDGTYQWLDKFCGESERIECLHLKSNLGGAGGFSLGIKLLTQKGYDYIWLMDDDTIPKENALERLLEPIEKNNSYGFLVSRAIWIDGKECLMNRPLFSKEPSKEACMSRVEKATFVSMLLPTKVVRDIGLPYKEFFIWGDDQEYTTRITEKYEAYQVKSSEVVHKSKRNVGSDIARDTTDRISLYFYSFRNEMFISRKQGGISLGYYYIRRLKDFWRVVLKSEWGTKRRRLQVLIQGIRAGISFTPKLEMISNE